MKLKHIALAVLAATSFGAANAAVLTTGQTAEIFVVAYDTALTKSFLLDTGVAASSLINGSINYSYDLSADANWTSFVSAVGASNVNWYVQTVSSITGTNTKFTYATLGAGASVGSAGSNSTFTQNTTGLITFLSNVNVNNAVNAGPSVTAAVGTADFVDTAYYGSLSADGVSSFSNALGTTGVSFFGAAISSKTSNAAKITQFAAPTALASLTATTLTIGTPAVVPSVPEPESYGLALVGLLLAGAVARRRAA
jgi:MYXO-CTERM domain-containing protein